MIVNLKVNDDDITSYINEIAVSNMSSHVKTDLTDLLNCIQEVIREGKTIAISK